MPPLYTSFSCGEVGLIMTDLQFGNQWLIFSSVVELIYCQIFLAKKRALSLQLVETEFPQSIESDVQKPEEHTFVLGLNISIKVDTSWFKLGLSFYLISLTVKKI